MELDVCGLPEIVNKHMSDLHNIYRLKNVKLFKECFWLCHPGKKDYLIENSSVVETEAYQDHFAWGCSLFTLFNLPTESILLTNLPKISNLFPDKSRIC